MLFMLILFGSLIALVILAFVMSRKIEYGEARFDSTTGKPIADDKPPPPGPVVPAQKIDSNSQNERKTNDE